MSDTIETLEHDATMCNLCCPHGITPAEAQLEYEHANILRMQQDTERDWPTNTDATEEGMRKFANSFGVDLGDISRVTPAGKRSYG